MRVVIPGVTFLAPFPRCRSSMIWLPLSLRRSISVSELACEIEESRTFTGSAIPRLYPERLLQAANQGILSRGKGLMLSDSQSACLRVVINGVLLTAVDTSAVDTSGW